MEPRREYDSKCNWQSAESVGVELLKLQGSVQKGTMTSKQSREEHLNKDKPVCNLTNYHAASQERLYSSDNCPTRWNVWKIKCISSSDCQWVS